MKDRLIPAFDATLVLSLFPDLLANTLTSVYCYLPD